MNTVQHQEALVTTEELFREELDQVEGVPDEISEADLEYMAALNLNSFTPERLTFAEWLEDQARLYRLRESDWHDFLSYQIEVIASRARVVDAAGPQQYLDRSEVLAAPTIGRRLALLELGTIGYSLMGSCPETGLRIRELVAELKGELS
jgi:hypothetical protein